MTSTTPAPRPLAYAAIFLILAPMLARAMSQLGTLPYWDFDPLIYDASFLGMGPAASMLCDAISILGAGLALLASSRSSSPRAVILLWTLTLLGCIPILYHGWLSPFATIQQQRSGAAWASAIISAAALYSLSRDRSLRAVIAAVLLGFLAMLAVKGAHQMAVEHAQTVADFQQGRERIFAAQGWSADSPMAKGYERRLLQNEASAWFGLSNPYSTFAAAGIASFAALLAAAVSLKRNSATSAQIAIPANAALALSAAGLLASIASLAMGQSKGATVAALLGVGSLITLYLLRKNSRVPLALLAARALPAAFVSLSLLAIPLRGLIGLRLGELSLLFRWYYIQAATRIALGFQLDGVHVGSPLLGVGPDGFKDAYLIAKNPLSPEEVSSPHSILFDWWACLGLFGLAWCMLLILALLRAGESAATPDAPTSPTPDPADPPTPDPADPHAPDHTRALIRLAVAIPVVATLVSISLHQISITPSGAIAYAAGLLAWCVLAGALVPLLSRLHAVGIALASGAVVLAAHAQIEVTGSLSNSAGLWAALIAVAAAIPSRPASQASTPRLPALAFAATLIASTLGLFTAGFLPAQRWQDSLASSAEVLSPVATARRVLDEIPNASERDRSELLTYASRQLAAALRRDVPPNPRNIASAAAELEHAAVPAAIAQLASIRGVTDWRVDRERARLQLAIDINSAAPGLPLPANPPWLLSISSPGSSPSIQQQPPWSSSLLQWNATALRAWADRTRDPAHLALAAAAMEQTQKLDPYNLVLAWRRLELARAQNNPATTADLAATVLRLNQLNRLDPTRRLSPSDEALAKSLASPPP